MGEIDSDDMSVCNKGLGPGPVKVGATELTLSRNCFPLLPTPSLTCPSPLPMTLSPCPHLFPCGAAGAQLLARSDMGR